MTQEQTIRLNIVPGGVPERVYIKQYDTDRVIHAVIYDNCGLMDLSDAVNVQVSLLRADKTAVVKDMLTCGVCSFDAENATVTITVIPIMTAIAGEARVSIAFRDSHNRLIACANFILQVEASRATTAPLAQEINRKYKGSPGIDYINKSAPQTELDAELLVRVLPDDPANWDVKVLELHYTDDTTRQVYEFERVERATDHELIRALNFREIPAYGVMWDYSQPDSKLTRIGASKNFLEPRAAQGFNLEGYSPYDDVMPWAGMKRYNIINDAVMYSEDDPEFDQIQYDTMVYIPEFWYKAVKDAPNHRWYWYISPEPKTGFEKHPGSGRYIGRYYSGIADNEAISRAQVPMPPTRMLNGFGGASYGYTDWRSFHNNKGNHWQMLDIATWSAVQLLYLIEYADFNARAKIGNGVEYDSSPATRNCRTGATDVLGNGMRPYITWIKSVYHTTNIPRLQDGKVTYEGANQYRWIELPFTQVAQIVDGLAMTYDHTVHLLIDKADISNQFIARRSIANDTNLINTGVVLPVGYSQSIEDMIDGGASEWTIAEQYEYGTYGLITGLAYVEACPWLFLPDSIANAVDLNISSDCVTDVLANSDYTAMARCKNNSPNETIDFDVKISEMSVTIQEPFLRTGTGYNKGSYSADGFFAYYFGAWESLKGDLGTRLVYIP